VAVATVANTGTETAVYTYAVPGGTLGSTRALRLTLIGDQLQNFAGSDTLTVRVKYGATTIYTGAFAVGQHADRRSFRLECMLSALNATNAQVAVATGVLGGATTTAGTGAAPASTIEGAHVTVAEDSTASKNLVVTIQQQTADTTISFRCHAVHTELV
jgi:hypothetical protein